MPIPPLLAYSTGGERKIVLVDSKDFKGDENNPFGGSDFINPRRTSALSSRSEWMPQ
jgi:hypothetical protein